MSLYSKIFDIFPLQFEGEDYRKNLSVALNNYKKLIIDPSYGLDAAIKDAVTQINEKIKDIAKNCYKGLPSTAYTKINNLLYSNKISLIETKITKDSSFYRMREAEQDQKFGYQDMFHIPVKLRRIVKTQRYSSPGYPCLYIGKSIYGCWEEMGRPHLNDCWVSRLQNEEELTLLDLKIPSEGDFNARKEDYIRLFPLIISCMMPVKNSKDIYKPEYIIPQLIIEYIIKTDKMGVIYTSVHRDCTSFDYPFEVYENIVIPVKNALDDKNSYDKKLSQLFSITMPTNNELEKLKEGYSIDGGNFDLEGDVLKQNNYNTSDFGQLENRLKNTAKYPLIRIN